MVGALLVPALPMVADGFRVVDSELPAYVVDGGRLPSVVVWPPVCSGCAPCRLVSVLRRDGNPMKFGRIYVVVLWLSFIPYCMEMSPSKLQCFVQLLRIGCFV